MAQGERLCYVYRHVRLDTNTPFYVGIGTNNGNNYKRSKRSSKRGIVWNRVVAKTNYRIDIIIENISWEDACEKEKEFIKLYGRKDLKTGSLVNKTNGGDGCDGILVSEQTRKKLREQNLGDKHWTNKMPSPLIGRKHSQEHKLKLSQAWVERKKRGFSEETRKKLSVANLGEKHHHFGKPQTEEVRRKISESSSGIKSPFLKYEIEVYKDDILLGTFNGGGEVAKATGILRERVYDLISGRLRFVGKYEKYFFNISPI